MSTAMIVPRQRKDLRALGQAAPDGAAGAGCLPPRVEASGGCFWSRHPAVQHPIGRPRKRSIMRDDQQSAPRCRASDNNTGTLSRWSLHRVARGLIANSIGGLCTSARAIATPAARHQTACPRRCAPDPPTRPPAAPLRFAPRACAPRTPFSSRTRRRFPHIERWTRLKNW